MKTQFKDARMSQLSFCVFTVILAVLPCASLAGELTSLVDPFWGNGKTESPESQGMARGWNWLKAQMGNTIPGALTPFGWVSVCAYTGNYPCGYGRLRCCCEGVPGIADKEMVADGFTHFHHCGTGFAGRFYNYFLFSPGAAGSDFTKFSRLTDETASPGHYAATLADRNCSFELTARPNAACHRYRFPSGKGRIVINAKHVGVREKCGCGKRGRETCEACEVREVAPGSWAGRSRFYGLDFHFAIRAKAARLSSSVTDGTIVLEVDGPSAETFIGFSLVDAKTAAARVDEAVRAGFDGSRREAEAKWEKALGRVRVRFADEKVRRRFYSTLYFSFVKPIDTEIGFLDYFTLWDVYHTELPLVLSLMPKTARRMMEDILSYAERQGCYPNSRNMTAGLARTDPVTGFHSCGEQAESLVAYVLADAFFRGVLTEADYPRLKSVLVRQLAGANLACGKPTHTLDYAGACRAAQFVAEACKDAGTAREMGQRTGIWRKVYNPGTGYLVNTGKVWYYEGNFRNYSFRAHTGMAGRIALAGGTDRYLAMLDDFFCVDYIPSQWDRRHDRVKREGYFEGLNNQSDMDAPFSYIWCGRPDRTAAVVDLVRRCRFTDGPGGCPGNNDSGATGSWYVWSCLGLYPVAGTPYYLIVSPSADRAEIDFARGTLTIRAERESPRSIYPVGFDFNGRSFREPWIRVRELESGGTLTIRLADRPAPSAPIPTWLD